MDGPGISLFQGGESIHLNTSNQREEEEFLEEEKARKAELQDLINNAFSDLDEDDIDTDSSISSSHCSRPGRTDLSHSDNLRSNNGSITSSDLSHPHGYSGLHQDPLKNSYNDGMIVVNHKVPFNGSAYGDHFRESNHVSAHQNHCFHSSTPPIQEEDELEIYTQSDLNSIEQFKVLYGVRLREIERLKVELKGEQEEKAQIKRNLALCEHDKKNLQISLEANRTLLTESRTKISELENEISKLNQQLKEIEKSNNELRSELEISKTQLFHEQQKFAALERADLNSKREKQLDMVLDSLKNQHRSEINALQKELDNSLERIQRKEAECNALERKLDEMEQKHAAYLLNKCDSSIRQETTLKALLDEANKEKLELTRQINALQQECTMLKNDLEQYDSIPNLRLNGNSSSDDKDTDSFILFSSGWRAESKKKGANLNQTDLINKLKEELHRALIGQRTKRKEIMRLQEQVQAKELQVSKLKEQERLYLSQIETLKSEMSKTLQQCQKTMAKGNEDTHLLAKLQSDIFKLENENSEKVQKIKSLEKDIENLQEKLATAAHTNKSYSEEYLEFYEKEIAKLKQDSDNILKDKELEWGREMEKIMAESDEVKKLYLDIKTKKDEVSKELHRVTCLYEEVRREKTNLEAQLVAKQQDIKKLEDYIVQMGKDKVPAEETSLKNVQKELNSIVEKQTAEITMLKAKLQDVAKNDEELHHLKEEISNSKVRYIELEKTLKQEFQESLIKVKEENSVLKESLKKKEAELSLRKMCMESQRRDISVNTEDSMIIERLHEQNLAEIEKLEKEISRLRALDEAKTQEILRISSTQEHRLNEALQQLEVKLNSKHQQEILFAEKKMKELSLKYFSEEMEKLQKQNSENLKAMRDEDYKKLGELQQLLARKEEEVKSLNARKEQLEAALKKYEDERAKAGLIMTQWAKEVEEIRHEKEKLIENVEGLKLSNSQITQAYEELQLKLRDTKKTALVYKRRMKEIKSSLAEKYKNLMIDLQKKVDDVVTAKEVEIKHKLQQIENDYKNKERLLLGAKNSDIT